MISLTARWHNHFLRDFYFLRDFLVKIRLFPDARRRFAVSEPISIILKVLKRWVSGIYFFFIRFCVVSLMTRSHVHFLRDSDFLRDFLDGHNCWDCTTSRRLYARTVLRSRKVSPMFAGRNSLIRPDGCLDMVPSSIFVTIFWESLSKNTSDYNRHQRGHKWSIGLNTIFSVSMSVFWMSSAGLWLQRSVHL